MPYLNHAANCGNSIIILKDPQDPKRPLFIVCSLRTHFFPRGIWQAYLYANHYPDPLDYRLVASFRLYFEPCQIPSWFTWRFLPRYLRARVATNTNRKLRKPDGLLIDPDLPQIALLCGEGGQHNRLGSTEKGTRASPQDDSTTKSPHRQGLPSTRFVSRETSGMPQSWLLWEQRKLCAVANGQASVSSPSIMGRHRGTSTASSDSVATQST